MNMSEWEAQYKPKVNHLVENASFQDEEGNGIMFETYGVEVDYVKTNSNEHIWTYVDGGDDESGILAGWHFVNRIGYFVTTEPWTDPNQWVSFTETEEA